MIIYNVEIVSLVCSNYKQKDTLQNRKEKINYKHVECDTKKKNHVQIIKQFDGQKYHTLAILKNLNSINHKQGAQ